MVLYDPWRYVALCNFLDECGYDVQSDPPGYIIRSHNDSDDVSRARHFSDLVDFVSLIAWRIKRYQDSTLSLQPNYTDASIEIV
jgi:hypothetical protein